MILLKPSGRLRRLPAGFDQAIDVLPENGIGQHALDLVARDRLQDDPGVMRDLPQFGIKLPPHFVGRSDSTTSAYPGRVPPGNRTLRFR